MTQGLGYAGKYLKHRPSKLRAAIDRLLLNNSATIQQSVNLPDVSFWQGVINWDTMAQRTQAVIIRAGQNTWIDPKFVRNYSEAKRVGLRRGVYWFYDDRVGPGIQANLLVSLLKYDMPEMEVYADWENSYGGPYGGLRNVVAFMEAVARGLPGMRIGLYTGYYFFRENSNATANASQYAYLQNKPLWLAWYTSDPANVLIPQPWNRIHLWQFGTPGVGLEHGVESREIDMNYYNGSQADFDARYPMAITEPPQDEEEPVNMGTTVYDNGVKVHTGNYNFYDYRAVVIPASAILSATFYKPSTPKTVEQVDGDFVFNFPPFNTSTNQPNLGVRIGNATISPYHDFEPFPYWNSTGLHIAHQKTTFNATVTAAQGFRYLVQNGIKNPMANADWNLRAARRLIGTNGAGDTIIVTVKGGDSTQSIGLTLHESAALMQSLGATWVMDGDGGSSVRDYLKVNNLQQVYGGMDVNRAVPVLGVIKFKAQCVTSAEPGTEPPPAERVPFTLAVTGFKAFSGELERE